ncbi:hypothetical protein N7478_007355 [Penicillium angulare]|uniref:uncharacterized protein n=1 Tax=Penicillium angulare TaxID=116970 RepID=UPI0025401C84|nr:uncharacterized protein N7478_007355 [Penicillium angulare]KAJ5281983.1 hypothetical protein N7478_007355 [Penicillium angulare]
MKFSAVVLAVFTLVSTGLADKTCTPSFDYCSDVLIKDKGFTEADLEDVIKGTDLEKQPLKNVLFHCKNPGIVGHPKLCESGCEDPKTEGSHSCAA